MEKKKIQAIRDFIENAEMSIRSAKRILKEILNEENIDIGSNVDVDTSGLHSYKSGEDKIVE
jgi:hypothetical protein